MIDSDVPSDVHRLRERIFRTNRLLIEVPFIIHEIEILNLAM